MAMSPSDPQRHAWLKSLSDEDWTFLKRFVLASGSLKELARVYGVSYPTVRLRLDRLIQKIEVVEAATELPPFERKLRLLLADGAIDAQTFKTLLEAHQEEMAQKDGAKAGDETKP